MDYRLNRVAVVGRLGRRQGPGAEDPTPTDTATTSKRPGLPGLTDIFPGKPTTSSSSTTPTPTPTSQAPAETAPPTNTSKEAEKPTETTSSSSSSSTQTAAPAETSKPAESQPANNNGGGAQQTSQQPAQGGASVKPTTSTELVIENKTITNPAGQQTTSLPAGKVGASSKNSFLENKVASGIVFGICGLVGLLLILLIVWLAMRKRRRIRKLEKEIISFDPEHVGHFHQSRRDGDGASIHSVVEKRSLSSLDQYAGAGYAPSLNANDPYRDAVPYADSYLQRQPSIQRPGNAAFNPTSTAGMYAMPPQTYR